MIVATGFEWMTHQPLIRVVMEVFKPKFVLELGIGIYSTPLFHEYLQTEYLGIENNREWINEIEDQLGARIIYHELMDIEEGTTYNDLTMNQRKEIEAFYKRLIFPNLFPRLLFVDQYSSCRAISINTLKDQFDFIIYHDSESYEVNRYDLVDSKGFKTSTLRTNGPCTKLMMKNDLDITKAIQLFIDEFKNNHANCTLMEFVND
jgi:hypothetical protein